MSLEIVLYTESLSDELMPQMIDRLNSLEMICEVHPDFSFEYGGGFVPFKFRLTNPPFPVLAGKELLSGFEFYLDDFDLEKEKSAAQPQQGFFDKLFGKKALDKPWISQEVDARLKHCRKAASFVWHAGDSFELRFASLTSAVLAEMTNGVCAYPADDIWYNNETLVEEAWCEVKGYETSLKERDLDFHEFERWD